MRGIKLSTREIMCLSNIQWRQDWWYIFWY